jgi:hypothetical protein
MAVLVEVWDTGKVEDYFRCNVFGNVMTRSAFLASRFFHFTEAAGIDIRYDAHPSQIQPEFDSMSTKWRNLQEMLQDKSVITTDGTS